ncbi:chloride channel protein [Bdellovibrio sp. 22V]|uniref:chloride channel protein n=1 Tax=Bdellovibrio sp. 22V TaxID=3044166 RepID=UPI002542F358|nr:chloride channel protein [Bdellovibrio sp. 22V]WII73722.1 chloride channel protein [Bdellovibrio sp. 22V]
MHPSRILKHERVRSAQHKILFNLPFWISTGIAALISVFYNKLFMICETWAHTQAHSSVILWTAPLAVLASFLLGHFISRESIGSGIPQVVAAVELSQENHPFLKKLLGVRMIFIKILASSICVLGGGVTGREGPTLQVSTAVFYQFSRLWPRRFPRPQLPAMILAGGAAGLASAFNTPLGGIVFAIEELSKAHISTVRTAVFQAVIIAGILAQLFLGNYLYLGDSNFGTLPGEVFYQTIIIAGIVGVLGSLFAEFLFRFTTWRSQKNFWLKVFLTALCGALLSLTIWFCGPSTIGAGKTVMVDLLKNPTGPVDPLLPIARIFGNLFTYIGGVVGGVFAPALSSGAALGQYLSSLFGFASMKLMIMVGMVAFLTGISRTPFTSFVLVLEMSDSHEIILYLMLSSLIANFSARLISAKGFYEKAAHGLIKQNASAQPITETV